MAHRVTAAYFSQCFPGFPSRPSLLGPGADQFSSNSAKPPRTVSICPQPIHLVPVVQFRDFCQAGIITSSLVECPRRVLWTLRKSVTSTGFSGVPLNASKCSVNQPHLVIIPIRLLNPCSEPAVELHLVLFP